MEAPSDDGRSQRQRMDAGDLYRVDDDLAASMLRAQQLQIRYNATGPTELDERLALLRELLGEVADDVVIRPPFQCDYGANIRIGVGTFANYGLVALDCAPITIGAHVQIATNVQLLTPTHPIDPGLRRDGWEAAKPITIGDNVWLGGGAIVLPGISIGENTVVGAGSVVAKNLPSGVVAVGNPARIVRRVD